MTDDWIWNPNEQRWESASQQRYAEQQLAMSSHPAYQPDPAPKYRCKGCGAKLETIKSKEDGKCITCREKEKTIGMKDVK